MECQRCGQEVEDREACMIIFVHERRHWNNFVFVCDRCAVEIARYVLKEARE